MIGGCPVGRPPSLDHRMVKAETTAVNPASRRSRQEFILRAYDHFAYVVAEAGSVTGLTAVVSALGGYGSRDGGARLLLWSRRAHGRLLVGAR
jgi:hypothetical protein